jgi:GTP-binding protein
VKVLRAELAATCARPEQFPRAGLPEVAFLGRSNVGKSSLLNRLAGRRKLARTSGTPGKTRLLHFFRIELPKRELLFVDLPGYGFAKVSKSEREAWRRLVESYLEDRAPLRAAILLQDLRRDASEDETLLLAWLAERDVAALVALTKVDKLRPGRRAARVKELRAQLALPAARVVPTSAATGEGIDALWRAILARLDE